MNDTTDMTSATNGAPAAPDLKIKFKTSEAKEAI
jgi:hypothetical protein